MLCGPNLKKKNSSDLLLPLNMLLIPGYPESLEEIIPQGELGFPTGSSTGRPGSAGDIAAA